LACYTYKLHAYNPYGLLDSVVLSAEGVIVAVRDVLGRRKKVWGVG